MSFQWIFNNAESISMERKKVVAQTTSRTGVVRSVNRGPQPWVFEVVPASGLRWTDSRPYISVLEALDRTTSATIQLNNTGYSWLSKYQGNSANYTGFVATITQGSTGITLTTSPTTTTGYKFRAGDFIQLGSSGKVYTVAADCAYNSNAVTLHRPVLESSATGVNLSVGPNATWTVICTQFPSWTISGRDLVNWNGSFVFHEVI